MLVATMPMLAKTISLGAGLDLEYVESGARNGLPVIFLHGVTDSGDRSRACCRGFRNPFTRLRSASAAMATRAGRRRVTR